MKYIILLSGFIIACWTISITSHAADKVVVIPLNSSQNDTTGWIYINPSSPTLSQGAVFITQVGHYAGIDLPITDNPGFQFGFTIPHDFKKGSNLTLHLLWHIEETGCTVSFQSLALSVARLERPQLTGSGLTDGLSIVGGSILNAPGTVNQSTETLVTITSPETGTDLEGGDSVILGFMRWPWHPDDTCNDYSMKIHGLSVSYPRE